MADREKFVKALLKKLRQVEELKVKLKKGELLQESQLERIR